MGVIDEKADKVVSIAEARAGLSQLVNDVAHGGKRVVLTSRGRPKAVLVPVEDLDSLDVREPERPFDEVLAGIARLVGRIRRRRKGKPVRPGVEDIYELREERS